MEEYRYFYLEQAYRDALVAYYLGQLVPSSQGSAPGNIVTPEDLYEYLLIDNQVSGEVDTSRVAQGIASLQQHVNAIYNGMEPGFGRVADTVQHRKYVQLWHEGSQYSNWAGYQMLADYPENYLDPSLRLSKTEAFQTFESELAQARLTPDTVQKALGHYLTRFEEVSNLRTMCTYIDGVDFLRSDYYFVGRLAVEPFTYYWRKAAMELDDSSTHVPLSAWTDWKKIEVNTAGNITHVRIVVVEGRLHLVWLEQLREAVDDNGQAIKDRYFYRLNISYLQNNGQWSPSIALRECTMPSVATLEKEGFVLIATFDDRVSAHPRVAIAFLKRNVSADVEFTFVEVRDKYWQPVNLGVVARLSLVLAMIKQMGSDPWRAQHLMEGADPSGKVWTLESVKWNPAGDNHIADINDYLELDVRLRMVEGDCKLKCVGICNMPWYQGTDEQSPFLGQFGIWKSQDQGPYALVLNGAARTPIQEDPWAGTELTYPMHFGMTSKTVGLGYNEFTITRKERSDAVPTIVTTEDGGVFLDLAALELPELRYVRLNTTFAGELVRKAERSLDGALGWQAQHMLEGPAPGGDARVPVDFNGANGRYFWELFFHVPHLVAWRLLQAADHAGAEHWLQYLFNPQVREAPLSPAPDPDHWLPYWTSRPLGFADDPSHDLAAPRDPDVIACGAPSHYRKAIFMLYVDNLIAWGDTLYRQSTRDALNEAKLLYVRALSLLGPLSKGRSISQWQPMSLMDAARHDDSAQASFEASFEAFADASLMQDLPRLLEGEAWSRLVDAPWFRLPVNIRLLDLWDQLDDRLYNLRNNLTLDGQPMVLALYESPANPLDLLRAQSAGTRATVRRLGALAIIPPYRFAAMLPRTRQAVDTLMQFGDQVRQYMESRDRIAKEALQQSHVLELARFVETLDARAVEHACANVAALVASAEHVQDQIDTYALWLEQGVSDAELSADELFSLANASKATAAELRATGQVLSMIPNTLSFIPTIPPIPPIPLPCGWNWGGGPWSAASVVEGVAIYFADRAEIRLRADAHRRREREWALLKQQAEQQLESLGLQAEQQQLLLDAAELKQKRTLKANEQAQSLYRFIQNRATNTALYQWLLAQMSTLYFQAYDSVLSLCLATEACWQYEIGDAETHFISAGAWADNRHGLTAGESLALGLLQMESAYLMRDERRLELVKTVSLRRLLHDYQEAEGEAGWSSVIARLRENGAIDFQLTPSLFDRDYPGHYLRQLVQMSVSLPGVLGPYEDAHAVLRQLTSSYLLKADIGGCKYMYQQTQELPGEHDDVNPRFVVANPRISQQVAISGDREDPGLHTARWGDERYLPFEGTGAVSSWTLNFPRHGSAQQQALFDGLQDIILHLRYRSMDGGQSFAEEVKALSAETLGDGAGHLGREVTLQRV